MNSLPCLRLKAYLLNVYSSTVYHILYLVALILMRPVASFNRVCYLRLDRPPHITQVEPHLCTHVILGFASVANSSIVPDDLARDHDYYRQAGVFRNEHKSFKLLLSVGGGGNDNGFHQAVASASNRRQLAQSAINLVHQFDFDGFDIDWEFPAWGNSRFQDRANFVLGLQVSD